MASKHGTKFRREAVRAELTSGLTRKRLAADLGAGFFVEDVAVPPTLMSLFLAHLNY